MTDRCRVYGNLITVWFIRFFFPPLFHVTKTDIAPRSGLPPPPDTLEEILAVTVL